MLLPRNARLLKIKVPIPVLAFCVLSLVFLIKLRTLPGGGRTLIEKRNASADDGNQQTTRAASPSVQMLQTSRDVHIRSPPQGRLSRLRLRAGQMPCSRSRC
eukprot:scaffold645_cov247-Pinguiococcus_pyrenoidosus.AAC.8